jgi:hypothetical protein
MAVQFEELRIVQDSYMRTWALYTNWYTWFLGLNVIAFGWVFSSTVGGKEINREYLQFLVFFMEAMIVAGLAPAFAMRKYQALTSDKGLELLGDRPDRKELAQAIFATLPGKTVPIVIISIHVIAAVLWLFVLLKV